MKNILVRMDVARGTLLELRRDLCIMRENVKLVAAPIDRYDEVLHLDALIRRLTSAIGSMNQMIGDTERRMRVLESRAKAIERDAQSGSVPRPNWSRLKKTKPVRKLN